MDGMDWVDESWESFDDSEFLPSPGLALAQRLVRGTRRGPTGRRVVPAGGARPTTPMAPQMRGELDRVYETMKRLEEKQDEQTKQLALLQSRSAGLQSADLFRQALSAAVANAATPIANGDWAAALAQVAPLVQNAQGAAASFSAKPVSTVAFPAAAAVAHAFRRRRRPDIIVTNPTKAALGAPGAQVLVSIVSPDGGKIRYERTPGGGDGKAVTSDSPEYTGQFPVDATSTITAKAFILWRGSEQAKVNITV
jgi:hypothetical protein